MKPAHLIFLGVPAVLISLACGGGSAPDVPPVAPADVAPTTAGGFWNAPDLGVTEWVRGDAVSLADTDDVVLIEHWATWCGPCKVEMPHLTALQAEHAGELTVIGLSEEPLSLVRPFVSRNEAVMGYTVAVAPMDSLMSWSRVAGADSIPYSYLVKAGQIVWHGHPAGLMPVLPHVLDGSWTADMAKTYAELPAFVPTYMGMLDSSGPDAARPFLDALLAVPDIGADVKNQLSWTILTEVPEDKQDLPLALSLVEQATDEVEHDSWQYEDTLGLALWMNNRDAEAVSAQAVAVTLCDAANAGAPCVELRERLERFEAGR